MALMLAPKSGKELRKDLNNQVTLALEKSDKVKDAVLQKGSEWKNLVADAKTKLTTTTKELADKVQFMTINAKEESKEVLQDAKKAIAELSEEIDKKLEDLKS